MSLTLGRFFKVTGFSNKSVAANKARALFFAPEILTLPLTLQGPLIKNLSISYLNFAKVMPSFERQTRRSLQELCKINGISGYSRMTKKMMTERLIQKGVKAPPVPLEALTKTELINAIKDMERHYRNG